MGVVIESHHMEWCMQKFKRDFDRMMEQAEAEGRVRHIPIFPATYSMKDGRIIVRTIPYIVRDNEKDD